MMAFQLSKKAATMGHRKTSVKVSSGRGSAFISC